MITKYEITKSLLFDGDEAEAMHKSFNLPAGDIKFSDFANNNFEDLRKVITPDDFETIVKTGGFNGAPVKADTSRATPSTDKQSALFGVSLMVNFRSFSS